MRTGSYIFLLGAVLEMVGLHLGTHSWAVALSMILYGLVLLVTGYLD